MDWTDLAVTLPVARVEEAAAIAQLVAGSGIYIEDYSDLEEQTQKIAHISPATGLNARFPRCVSTSLMSRSAVRITVPPGRFT